MRTMTRWRGRLFSERGEGQKDTPALCYDRCRGGNNGRKKAEEKGEGEREGEGKSVWALYFLGARLSRKPRIFLSVRPFAR